MLRYRTGLFLLRIWPWALAHTKSKERTSSNIHVNGVPGRPAEDGQCLDRQRADPLEVNNTRHMLCLVGKHVGGV